MTSEVSICNLALSHIRAGPQIASLDENTTPAIQCKLWYEVARDLALADIWWNFSGKQIVLAQQVEVPLEWAFGYAYPIDCLQIRYIINPGKLRQEADRIEFEVSINAAGNKTIMTNQDEACLKYTFQQTDPNSFHPHFVVSMSYQLALHIAVPVAGTSKGRILKKEASEAYLNAIRAAVSADSAEEYVGTSRESLSTEAYL